MDPEQLEELHRRGVLKRQHEDAIISSKLDRKFEAAKRKFHTRLPALIAKVTRRAEKSYANGRDYEGRARIWLLTYPLRPTYRVMDYNSGEPPLRVQYEYKLAKYMDEYTLAQHDVGVPGSQLSVSIQDGGAELLLLHRQKMPSLAHP